MGASGIYRLAAPADALRRTGFANTLISYELPGIEAVKAMAPDNIVMKHFFTDACIAQARIYRQYKNAFIGFEIDDLFWELDDANPAKAGLPTDILSRMRRVVGESDATIVSTPILAEHVTKSLGVQTGSIRIVRNQLPQAFITAALAARDNRLPRKDARPRIGWAGGSSHPGDLALLTDVVKNTKGKYQWVFLGAIPPGISQAEVEFHASVPFSQYATKLSLLDLDIAVAPLADTVFNSCKSDLRALEYGACGYPVIASASPAFADTPYLTSVMAPHDWEDVIDAAVNDTDGLADAAQKLHDWVKSHRVIESRSNLERWAWAWTDDRQALFRPSEVYATATPPVIVGEPVTALDMDNYPTIKEAAQNAPGAPIVYIRQHSVPTIEQVAELIDQSEKGMHLSACALSNDGDYPAPGRFIQLPGKTMRYMVEAALNLPADDTTPIKTAYAGGPLQYLSAKALATVGIPDESRYGGDCELAIMDWCLRLQDMGGHDHVVLPNLFVPAHIPNKAVTDPEGTKKAIGEMTTWHPSFQPIMQEMGKTDRFANTRSALDLSYARISYEAPSCKDYAEWTVMHDAVTPAVKSWAEQVLRQLGSNAPVISVVMPVYNAPPGILKEAIESVVNQLYPHWQLIIIDDASTDAGTLEVLSSFAHPNITINHRRANGNISEASNDGLDLCGGEWVTFLDHDDTLAPFALTAIADAIHDNPKANLIYGDSDMLDPEGKLHSPDFKPDFDYDLFMAQNYICHPAVYRLSGIRDIGGFRTEYNGSQDYDLSLRYIEHMCWNNKTEGPDRESIHHIPLVLYHWRQSPNSVSTDLANKPYALEAAHKAVFEHLQRTDKTAFIGAHPSVPIHHLVRFLAKDPQPKVTIVILTQTDRRRLENCLTSIFKRTVYKNYDVMVRQVGSDSGISETLKQFSKKHPNLSYHKGSEAFHFALLNNTIVKQSISPDTEVVVFLNDDTEIIEPSWLNDMAGTALRKDVGAVGVKTIYPNKQVQHNGIVIDYDAPEGEFALHAHRGASMHDPGAYGRGGIAHQAVAVTAACMAVRKELFLAVGGFDIEHFPMDYNDVDLCFRLYEAGYNNVVLSHLVVVHLEGGTKRTVAKQVPRAGMLESEKELICLHSDSIPYDPYGNPNREHHPSGAMIRAFPYRPWYLNKILPHTLLVGGDSEDARALFTGGELAYRAEPDGPYLRLSEPGCDHGGVVDLRDTDGFIDLLRRLDIGRIVLRRLGSGSAETVLGALAHASKEADIVLNYWAASFEAVCPRLDCTNSKGSCGHLWKTDVDGCQSCIDRDGSPYGFISVTGWRLAWARFSQAINQAPNSESTSHDAPTTAQALELR